MQRTAIGDVPSSFLVSYCGFSVLDFNTISTASFRWIVGELLELLPLGKEDVLLTVVTGDDKKAKVVGTQTIDECGTELVVLEHSVDYIWKFLRWPDDGRCFAYLIRTNPDFPFTCHAFTAETEDHAEQIAKLLNQTAKRIVNETAEETGLSHFDIPRSPFLKIVPSEDVPSSTRPKDVPVDGKMSWFSSHFEALYLCRVEIIGSPSCAIVDEAARKYDEEYKTMRAHEFLAASMRRFVAATRRPRDDNLRTRLRFSDATNDGQMVEQWESPAITDDEKILIRRRKSSLLVDALVDSVFDDGYASSSPAASERKISFNVGGSLSLADLVRTCANSNRSILISIARHEISLISLTDKQKLLQKRHTEISCIVRGSKYDNHFAFVCPDPRQTNRSDCFVMRCQDTDIADGIIRTMRAAFTAAFNDRASAGGRHHACDRCPLYQYSCLCSDINGMQPREIHDIVINRINRLSPSHQNTIWSGYKNLLNECGGADATVDSCRDDANAYNSSDIRRKNIMLMSVLRSVCESAQILHSHSVGKISNPGSGTAVPTAASDGEIYLTVADGISNSTTTKGEKRSSNDIDSTSLSSSWSYQRFSAVNKLVSLRDRAKDALGGSLDSFIKRKVNNNDNEASGSSLTLKEHTVCSGGDSEPVDCRPSNESDLQCTNEKAIIEEMNYVQEEIAQAFSPPSPPATEDMATVQAIFHFESPGRRGSEGDLRYRPRSSTVGDVFTLYGANYERPVEPKQGTAELQSRFAKRDPKERSNSSLVHMRGRRMSWRQAILNRVISPRLFVSRHSVAGLGIGQKDVGWDSRRSSGVSAVSSPTSLLEAPDEAGRPVCYKSLWQKAIMEQILTLRLENQKRARSAETEETRKLKLTYEEITPCSEDEVRPIWLAMLNHPDRHSTRFNRVQLEEAVKAGVPRDLRHEVWKFLLSQHMLDRAKRAQMETPQQHRYQDLLKELTSYQHSILIDLGRTFPSHSYFSQPLGAGQLSLFNILKAYSLFDSEVGYCQGLSFVAGVLLLHMAEQDAFEMLVDMMYRLQLRRQYRPDMMALQIEMYQLSRLLHDRHKDLHEHLEEHEIPILYAAPWFLTLFASAFPLGFVARVFDFVFLAGGLDVVFKIAVTLLGDHKELIKHCDSFESISDFLKTTLPSMSIIQMERIFNQVVELDISRELLAYEVEYHVLQEEVLASPLGAPSSASLPIRSSAAGNPENQSGGCTPAEFAKLDTANKFLKRQNMELLEQLQQSRYQLAVAEKAKLEMQSKLDATNDIVSAYQCKLSSLETRIEAMEIERKSLLAALQHRSDFPDSNSANVIESRSPLPNGVPSLPRSKPA